MRPRSHSHLNFEVVKAREKFAELAAQGKLTGETFGRQTAALVQLPAAIQTLAAAMTRELEERRAKAAAEAGRELREKLLAQEEETFASRRRAAVKEIELLRQKLQAEKTLTGENQALLVELERAMLNKIARERSMAYARTLRDLQQELGAIISSRFTTMERRAFSYQSDLERFSAAQEAKAKDAADSQGEINAIEQQYAMNRQAALRRYQLELNVLRNSQGWQGVFGEHLAQQIRGNEELLREWAESTNRAAMMVRVTLETLAETGRRAFGNLSQGMAANVAHAIVYRQSIGEAMRAALAATLQSIAAESFVNAIYATALGFLRLAQHDYVAAGKAFTAAAIFGSVGVAAAVAGRAVAPRPGGPGGRDSGGDGGSGREVGGGATGGQERREPRVQIVINGHVVGRAGVEELTDMINEAVKDRDVRLVATQVRQAGREGQ